MKTFDVPTWMEPFVVQCQNVKYGANDIQIVPIVLLQRENLRLVDNEGRRKKEEGQTGKQ